MSDKSVIGAGPDLAAFLARHEPVTRSEAVWRRGTIRLRIDCYLSREPPPSGYVTSVRSIVLRGGGVLTVRNAEEWHVLPVDAASEVRPSKNASA